jgi:hypothetical protein
LETALQTHADVLPPLPERVGESQCRRPVARDWRHSTDKGKTMTLRASSPSLLAPRREGRERSLWRKLLGVIMEGRQRKADGHVWDYLRHHRGEHAGKFRRELEQRNLDQ